MKILIIKDHFHHKNKKGLDMLLNHLNIEHKYSNKYIKGYDIVYSPAKNIKTNTPTIYGPHFSVSPDKRIFALDKGIYIQPSEWAKKAWNDVRIKIPIYSFPFPVETDRFKPIEKNKNLVLLYYKRRNPEELEFLKEFLKNENIDYKIFDYVSKYREEDYLISLQNSKYMVVLDAHESQGFALEEALSCDVPLLVWNVKSMNQEYGQNYNDIPASTVPYWDERCGELFYTREEFSVTYKKFIANLDSYKPRDYILENLSVEKCSKRFEKLIKLLDSYK